MDIIALIMSNPAIRDALWGTGVKFVVDWTKKLFKTSDEQKTGEKYKIPLQLLVIVCSGLAGLAQLALSNQLGTFDTNLLVNFFVVALPTYLSALGVHFGAKAAINAVKAKEVSGDK